MSFRLSTEQREFQDSLRSFFGENTSVARLQERNKISHHSDKALWQKYAELGLFDFFLSEDQETAPRGLDLFYIAFECGYALESEGLWESLLGGPFLFRQLNRGGQDYLSESGHAHFSLACWPQHNSLVMKGETVSGTMRFAIGRLDARFVACCFNRPNGEAVIGYIDVEESGAKCAIEVTESMDISKTLLSISCTDVPIKFLTPNTVGPFLQLFRALKAAEVAGAATRALEMTTEYVKTRKQFGVPVGGFQAVQHRLADMLVRTESMRALAQFAAWAVQASPEEAELAARSALLYASEAGPLVIEGAIQLHGGIGFTWEYDLHFYLKRVKAIEQLYSSSDQLHELLGVASSRQSASPGR